MTKSVVTTDDRFCLRLRWYIAHNSEALNHDNSQKIWGARSFRQLDTLSTWQFVNRQCPKCDCVPILLKIFVPRWFREMVTPSLKRPHLPDNNKMWHCRTTLRIMTLHAFAKCHCGECQLYWVSQSCWVSLGWMSWCSHPLLTKVATILLSTQLL
jgi:hypothetical protein